MRVLCRVSSKPEFISCGHNKHRPKYAYRIDTNTEIQLYPPPNPYIQTDINTEIQIYLHPRIHKRLKHRDLPLPYSSHTHDNRQKHRDIALPHNPHMHITTDTNTEIQLYPHNPHIHITTGTNTEIQLYPSILTYTLQQTETQRYSPTPQSSHTHTYNGHLFQPCLPQASCPLTKLNFFLRNL